MWIRGLLALLLAGTLACASGRLATSHPAQPGSDAAAITAAQVMVMLKPAPAALGERVAQELAENYRLRAVFSWPMASVGCTCIVYEVPVNRSPAEIAARLATDPRVRAAAPIHSYRTLGAGDPYSNLQKGAQMLHVEQAHRVATGRGVRVAVVDTGVDLDHPDLRGRIVKAGNFVDRGATSFTSDVHGTAVAGVIAADEGNGIGIYGVAPDAEVYALKACWPDLPGSSQAQCNSYTLAKAVDYAITERAQVMNFSLAGPDDPILAALLKAALGKGIAVIAATAPAVGESFPASLEGVIPVVDTDLEGRPRSTPAAVPGALLGAPGVDVLTTVPRGSYDFFSGSSFAAAEVTGIAALLLEIDPGLKPADLYAALAKNGRAIGVAAGTDPRLVDACSALLAIRPGTTCR